VFEAVERPKPVRNQFGPSRPLERTYRRNSTKGLWTVFSLLICRQKQNRAGSDEQAAPTITQFPIHPLCAMFPDLPVGELNELAESIRRDGQQEPAVVHQGQIIDGRIARPPARWQASNCA